MTDHPDDVALVRMLRDSTINAVQKMKESREKFDFAMLTLEAAEARILARLRSARAELDKFRDLHDLAGFTNGSLRAQLRETEDKLNEARKQEIHQVAETWRQHELMIAAEKRASDLTKQLEAQNEITVQQAIKLSIAQKRATELEAALREVDDHATGMERFNITVGNTIGFIRDTVRKALVKDQQ